MRPPPTRFARPLQGAPTAAWQSQFRGSRSAMPFFALQGVFHAATETLA